MNILSVAFIVLVVLGGTSIVTTLRDTRLARATIAFMLFIFVSGAHAATPQLPCAGAFTYSPPNAPPSVTTWGEKDLEQWRPPTCTGWATDSRSKLVVAVSGSFRYVGAINQLLARIGAISTLPRILYWSTTDKKWMPLSKDAFALTGPDSKSRRGDFSASEFVKGAELFYWDDDTRTDPAVYRSRVVESTPDRVVVANENLTPIRRFLFTLFKPGDFQTLLIIQRVSPGIFGAYILNRNGEGASSLTTGHDKSYVNRAVALFRQLAGMKTDQDPPAAP